MKVLFGGLPAWKKAGFRTSMGSTPQTIAYTSTPLEGVVDSKVFTQAATARNADTILIDVRSDDEVVEGVITGAVAIPADEIMGRLGEIPQGKQILIYCASGVRAAMVYSLLKDRGFSAKYLDKIVTVQNDGSFIIQDHSQNL